jgi:hypothetical protein
VIVFVWVGRVTAQVFIEFIEKAVLTDKNISLNEIL